MDCVFCEKFIDKKQSILENDLALAYYDEFPVSKGRGTKRMLKTQEVE